MGGGSAGALAPTVKPEPSIHSASPPQTLPLPPPQPLFQTPFQEGSQAPPLAPLMEHLDKDMLCPICKQIIKDAFLTPCGHSFCYICILTHLRNKSDCPRCAHYLTVNNIFPNILLDKLLRKTSARQTRKPSSPLDCLRQGLQQGCDLTIKELDELLALLAEKKRKMEQEEAEANMQILLGFLYCLRKQKLEELDEVLSGFSNGQLALTKGIKNFEFVEKMQADLQYIMEDINAVERRRIELCKGKYRNCGNSRMHADDPVASKAWPSMYSNYGIGDLYGTHQSQGLFVSNNFPILKVDSEIQESSHDLQREDAYGCSDSQLAVPRISEASKRRIHSQFNKLQECYLQKRRDLKRQLPKAEEIHRKSMSRDGYCPALEDFHSILKTFARYSRLRVVAELRQGDLFHSANIVSSIEFDRDDELFAIAGVSRCIKVFEFSSILNEPADVHFPVVEMSTRSKLSCLSWNKYTKNHIASSDYEGIVTVWDVHTRQSVMEYEEHEKRAWSVDFSRTEPSMLVSGSDDCKVKIWSMKQEASALNIDIKANVCSVKYNPGTSMHVAVGCADHNIHYYDLRNISQPLCVFNGHRKAVSYVKFLSNNELASASTDSTLRLWDVNENLPMCTYRGHANEKNFVGLTVNSEYIACGSETNEVYVYHKAIWKPMARHRFSSGSAEAEEGGRGSFFFISGVCWKSESPTPTILTANSQGTIKVLELSD